MIGTDTTETFFGDKPSYLELEALFDLLAEELDDIKENFLAELKGEKITFFRMLSEDSSEAVLVADLTAETSVELIKEGIEESDKLKRRIFKLSYDLSTQAEKRMREEELEIIGNLQKALFDNDIKALEELLESNKVALLRAVTNAKSALNKQDL